MFNQFLKITFFALLSVSAASASAEGFDAAEKYKATCAMCHDSGAAGAPRKGDEKAWSQRMSQGEDTVLNNVKNGIGAMPAKGLCADCSDEQFKALIKYLAN
jgi:cytochrome c5